VVEIGSEPLDAGDGIADGLRQRRFARYPGELSAEPRVQIIKNRLGLGLPQSHPFIPWRSTRLFLDGVKLSDAPDRLFGDGGALGLLHIDELAPDMRHAGDFMDITGSVELVEPGIAVRVHPALVAGQMFCRVLALAVDGELIPGSGWRAVGSGASPWPFIPCVCPEPRGFCPA
jgi:hypothetical protein